MEIDNNNGNVFTKGQLGRVVKNAKQPLRLSEKTLVNKK